MTKDQQLKDERAALLEGGGTYDQVVSRVQQIDRALIALRRRRQMRRAPSSTRYAPRRTRGGTALGEKPQAVTDPDLDNF